MNEQMIKQAEEALEEIDAQAKTSNNGKKPPFKPFKVDLVGPGKVVRVDLEELEPLGKANELKEKFWLLGKEHVALADEVHKAKLALGKAERVLEDARDKVEECDTARRWWDEWYQSQEAHWERLGKDSGIDPKVIAKLTKQTPQWEEQMALQQRARDQWAKYDNELVSAKVAREDAKVALEMSEAAAEKGLKARDRAGVAWKREIKRVEKAVLSE